MSDIIWYWHFGIQIIFTKYSHLFQCKNFNWFANPIAKIETKCCLLVVHMASIKCLWLQINNYYFMAHCTFHCIYFLRYSLASFKWCMVYMIITLSIYYVCYVKMQLNDVIKSISWYRPFVALLIQIDIAKNSIDTDTGIGISVSLRSCYKFEAWWSDNVLGSNLKCLLYFCALLNNSYF